jgi:hypothetical protein
MSEVGKERGGKLAATTLQGPPLAAREPTRATNRSKELFSISSISTDFPTGNIEFAESSGAQGPSQARW